MGNGDVQAPDLSTKKGKAMIKAMIKAKKGGNGGLSDNSKRLTRFSSVYLWDFHSVR